ncbi:hypothetical protein HY485_03105 [Candidatus Woesearchaeota archaeon]|nr:hypothetical protein [Candidatus Woesearchaeota archaeon]
MKHEEEAESINDLMGCLKNTPVVNIGGAPAEQTDVAPQTTNRSDDAPIVPPNPSGFPSYEIQKLADAGAEMAKTLELAVADVQREREAGNQIWAMHKKEMSEYRARAITGIKGLLAKVRDMGVAKMEAKEKFETERARLETELMAKGKQSTYFETELAAKSAAYEQVREQRDGYEAGETAFIDYLMHNHPKIIERFFALGPQYNAETHEVDGTPLTEPKAFYKLEEFVVTELAKELEGLHANVESLETAVKEKDNLYSAVSNERDVLKTKFSALEAQDAVDAAYLAEQTAFLIAANDKALKYLAELRHDKK